MGSFVTELSQGEQADLWRAGQEVRYEPGQALMRQGDAGEYVVVTRAGRVKVVRNEVDGDQHLLGVCRPGALLGEIACVDEGPRSASVIAFEPVVGVRVFKSQFLTFMDEHPRVSRWVIRRVAGLVRAAEERTAKVRSVPVEARVLCGLAKVADEFDEGGRRVVVPFGHEEIRQLAAVSPASVQRALAALQKRHLVVQRRGKVEVPCLGCLRAAAQEASGPQKCGETITGCRSDDACPRA